MTSIEKLNLAKKHLAKVQDAWDDPTDWDDLSLYGFYCLEAAVESAALHEKIATTRKHWEKAQLAQDLSKSTSLPDISALMTDMNSARKASGYGDIVPPALDAEDVATRIGEYVAMVEALVN